MKTAAFDGFPQLLHVIFSGMRWLSVLLSMLLTIFTRIAGPLRTKELALTGRRIDAREALSIGVLSQVVQDDAVGASALAIAKKITENVQAAVQGVKRSVDHLVGFRQGFDYDIEVSNVCYFSSDRKAAVGKFGGQAKSGVGEIEQGERK